LSTAISDRSNLAPASTVIANSALALVLSLAIWILIAAFIVIPSEYFAFGLAATSVGVVEVWRRLAPWSFEGASDAISQNVTVFVFVSIFAVAALPFAISNDPYWIHILTMVFIYGFAAQGLNVHLGEMGAINVGYAGLFAIGAYSSAISVIDFGANYWICLIFATAICWLAGLLIGACTIRTSGDYLSLVTLGFGLILYQLAVNVTWITHGTDGVHIPRPELFGHSFDSELNFGSLHLPKEANFYYVALIFLLAAMILSRRIANSWIGRTLAAMRQDPIGAGCFGINIPAMRLLSFAFGSAFAGISGGLYAGEIGFIEPGEFTIFMSITLICMVILGGMGNWWGIVIGAFIMIVVPEKLRHFQELRYLFYGIVLLTVLIYRPYGLFASLRRKQEKLIG
jgi:branched-chain amino acid transport system permease protein